MHAIKTYLWDNFLYAYVYICLGHDKFIKIYEKCTVGLIILNSWTSSVGIKRWAYIVSTAETCFEENGIQVTLFTMPFVYLTLVVSVYK